MTLGIFLALGDSFKDMKKSGQDVRFKKYYLKKFSKSFENVYIFSYENENVSGLPKNVKIIPNKYNLHRYIYGILFPFINYKIVLKCDAIRAYHLSGTIPAIIVKIFLGKNYCFNYAYNYKKVSRIENKYFRFILFIIIEPFSIFFSSKLFAANKIILRSLPKEKTIYLPNGVDTNIFKHIKEQRNAKPVLLSVGRLEKQKNFERLIIAVKGLDIKLKIVGRGKLKNKLIKLAYENKIDLEIMQKVPNTQMPKIYNKADLFVLSSVEEGSPKALLEAMSSQLPIIFVTKNELKEIVKNNFSGVACQPNLSDLKSKINLILHDSKFSQNLSKTARTIIRKNFNIENLIKLEVETIKSLE